MIDLTGKLEEEARDSATAVDAGIISIAVSLKRIADVIEGNQQKFGLVEAILENLKP